MNDPHPARRLRQAVVSERVWGPSRPAAPPAPRSLSFPFLLSTLLTPLFSFIFFSLSAPSRLVCRPFPSKPVPALGVQPAISEVTAGGVSPPRTQHGATQWNLALRQVKSLDVAPKSLVGAQQHCRMNKGVKSLGATGGHQNALRSVSPARSFMHLPPPGRPGTRRGDSGRGSLGPAESGTCLCG